jgi:hypothetical protein
MNRLVSALSSHRFVGSVRTRGLAALTLAGSIAGVGLVVAPARVHAQDAAAAAATPAGFIQVTAVTVKPSGVAEFEEYVKRVTAATTKVSGRPVLAFQRMYGNPTEYFFVVSMTDEKDLDGLPTVPQAVMKAYGDVEGARLLKTGRAVVERITVERHDTIRAISTNLRADAAAPSKYYQVMRSQVKPEMAASYRNVLEKIKKAEELQPGAVTAIRRVVSEGGSPYDLVVVRGFDSFAERDKWSNQGEVLRKVYGDAEAREMNATIGRAIAQRESTVLAYRGDLSSTAPPAATRQH